MLHIHITIYYLHTSFDNFFYYLKLLEETTTYVMKTVPDDLYTWLSVNVQHNFKITTFLKFQMYVLMSKSAEKTTLGG